MRDERRTAVPNLPDRFHFLSSFALGGIFGNDPVLGPRAATGSRLLSV